MVTAKSDNNAGAGSAPAPRWDTANLKCTYANFCTVNSTREEVVLNFGINKSWERDAQAPEVELNHRIVMSPLAARRLAEILNQLVREYETRYGALPK